MLKHWIKIQKSLSKFSACSYKSRQLMATLSSTYTALTLWQIQCKSWERRIQSGHKFLFLVDKDFNSITLRPQQPGGSPEDLKTNYLSPTSARGVFSTCWKYFMSWHGKQSLFSNISSEEVARRETKGNFFCSWLQALHIMPETCQKRKGQLCYLLALQ